MTVCTCRPGLLVVPTATNDALGTIFVFTVLLTTGSLEFLRAMEWVMLLEIMAVDIYDQIIFLCKNNLYEYEINTTSKILRIT